MWFKTKGHIETENGRLQFAGRRDLETIAKEFNTPIYVCNLTRIKDNYSRVKKTFLLRRVSINKRQSPQ
jgi:diaminopimelate decarboxylase